MKPENTEHPAFGNFAVLASLVDMLRQLNDHGALIGRLGSQIIIDTSQAPALVLDELDSIFQGAALTSDDGNGWMRVFSRVMPDATTGTLLLNADMVIGRDSTAFKEFPALRDITRLIEGIPPLPAGELSDHYAAVSDGCVAAVRELLHAHGGEIPQAMFSGPDDDQADQAPNAPQRTLN